MQAERTEYEDMQMTSIETTVPGVSGDLLNVRRYAAFSEGGRGGNPAGVSAARPRFRRCERFPDAPSTSPSRSNSCATATTTSTISASRTTPMSLRALSTTGALPSL